MKKTVAILGVVAIVAIAYSCKKKSDSSSGGKVYLDLPATAYQYGSGGMMSKTVNEKATLGRVLFYDAHLSINNATACASCHKQAAGFADTRAFSPGFEGRLTSRNSPGIANVTGDDSRLEDLDKINIPLFWDGRENTLQDLIARPVTNHVEMGINDFGTLPEKLNNLDYYPELFQKAYGDKTITAGRISECVAVFVASIRSSQTKFDQFIGDKRFGFGFGTPQNPSVFSAEEYNGYNLFITKYQCQNCHHLFTNSYSTADFKDIGLDKNYSDKGKGVISGESTDNGKFKTPNLRNVALSAPYMHDGRYKNLNEVIEHYSTGINNSENLDWNLRDSTGSARKMNITDNEKKALVAFLGTLTDYSMVTDPKFSNPFKVK